MKKVNALEIRNHLGAILDELEHDGEPILVSKGRRLRAAPLSLVSIPCVIVHRDTKTAASAEGISATNRTLYR